MNGSEEFVNDFAKTLAEFSEIAELAMNIKIDELPFELQLQLLNENHKLYSAIKSYNVVVKQAIIVDAMMKGE